jgi:hypothetical protein
MALKTSRALSKQLLDLLSSCKIMVWGGGTIPTLPDDATTSDNKLIWTIVKDPTGTPAALEFEASADGSRTVGKPSADTWGGAVSFTANGGTPLAATFFRVVPYADDGTSADATDDDARLQGTVGTTVAFDMIVENATFTAGQRNVSSFSLEIPVGG